jgi:N-acetylneuraminic acid mutarotase
MKARKYFQDQNANAHWFGQILALIIFCVPCNIFGQAWTPLNNIGAVITGTSSGAPPTKGLSISLNGKIYSITNTVWEYDPGTDSWKQRSMYPGTGLVYQCAFTIGAFAYIGSGYSGTSNIVSDFYKYDPASDSWTPIASIPAARANASAFSVGGKGYVCCGTSTAMGSGINDLWEYDPASNSWTQKANLPGQGRYDASAFSSGAFGYVGLGYSSNTWYGDFYKYDPSTNTWSATSAFPGQGRCGAGAVVKGAFGIIICGNHAMTAFNDCYSYNTANDTWASFPSFGGSARSYVLFGIVTDKIFAGGGTGGGGTPSYSDWWSVQTPLSVKDNSTEPFERYNVFVDREDHLILRTDVTAVGIGYKLFDAQGKQLCMGIIRGEETRLDLASAGMYLIAFDSERMKPMKFIYK